MSEKLGSFFTKDSKSLEFSILEDYDDRVTEFIQI